MKYLIDVKDLYYEYTTQLMLLNNQVGKNKFNFTDLLLIHHCKLEKKI